jgi:uncharacterized protein YjbJ (UPF0337 family)
MRITVDTRQWNIKHTWDELCGPMSRYWSKVNEDALRDIDGQEDKLTELIQQRYHCNRQRAVRDIERFFDVYEKYDD